MPNIVSAQNGEIIDGPLELEVYETLPKPKENYEYIPDNDLKKVQKWQSRIEAARAVRGKNLKNLTRYIDYYEGLQWHDDDEFTPIKDKSTINLIFANIKEELPNLYFKNPTPIVNAKSNEYELGAFAMQNLLKSYTEFNLGTSLKKHVRLCILDAKFSYGCIKAIYTPMFSENPRVGKPRVIGSDDFGNPVFLTDETGNVMLEDGEILTAELYEVERVSPREILVDVQCRNFPEKSKWIGHEIVKSKKYLKDHPLYKNTEYLKANVEPSVVFRDILNKKSEEIAAVKLLTDEEDTELVKFVEIYDFEKREILVLPDEENFFIREEELFINPFEFLKFNEKPDSFFPISDISQEKPLQQEVNVGHSMLITHARRSARKYAYTEDTFRGIDDAEGMESMKSPEDLTLVKVSELNQAPIAIGSAPADATVFQELYQSRNNFNEVSGRTEAQRGTSVRRKTNDEVQFQEMHSLTRRGDKQSLVADFIKGVYSKLGKLMQETLTLPQAVKIIGKTGVFWSKVDRENIQGELLYDINVSELRPQIPEFDRKELSEFLFALANFLTAVLSNPIGTMIFNLQGVISEFAKAYPSVNTEKILNGQITPEQIAAVAIQLAQKKQTGMGQANNANV